MKRIKLLCCIICLVLMTACQSPDNGRGVAGTQTAPGDPLNSGAKPQPQTVYQGTGGAAAAMDPLDENTSETDGIAAWIKSDAFEGAKSNPNAKSDMQVTVALEIPEVVTEAPVYRGTPRDVTVDEVKRWAQVMLPGETLYVPENPLEPESGSEAGQRQETDWTYHSYWYYKTDGDSWKDSPEYDIMDKSMELAMETLRDAHGEKGVLSSTNRTAEDFLMHSLNFYYSDDRTESKATPAERVSRKSADAMAGDVLTKLGFDSWALEECFVYNDNVGASDTQVFKSLAANDSEGAQTYEGYNYSFVPVYGGHPAFYAGMVTVKSADENAAHYYYENIQIIIRGGRVELVSWYSPLEITKTEVERAKLLDMDMIYECFKKTMQSQAALDDILGPDETDRMYDVELRVTNAEFVMARIKEKDSDDFLVVPAWLFTADFYVDGKKIYSEFERDVALINAVDGSSINIELGY